MSIQTYPSLNDEWNNLKLTVLENGLFFGDSSWNHPDMMSPFNRLYFIIEGQAYLENELGRWDFTPGSMYLIPAGSRYSFACTSTIRKFYIHFNLELLPGVDLFSRLDSFRCLSYPPELLDIFLKEAGQESLSGLLHIKSLLWDILYRFFLETVDETGYLNYFKGFYRQQHVLCYLSAHLSAGLRIQDLAAALNIPPHILSRSFRQDTGIGLKEYMEHMLLQKARHLLLHTNLPIYEISEILGFTDPFYFSRFFKKLENLSPRSYRRQGF